MSKLRSMRWVVLAAALALGATHSAWAAVSNNSDNVTVTVESILSVSDETGNFTIKFDNATGSSAGSISTGQTVGYIVASNTMPNAALAAALSAKISVPLTDKELRAVGGNYVNDGTASNAILESAGDPVVVGTTAVALANKPASTGTAGKVLKGKWFVNWSAKALADLFPSSETVTLTVTLKDA